MPIERKDLTCSRCGTISRVQVGQNDDPPCPECLDYALMVERARKGLPARIILKDVKND